MRRWFLGSCCLVLLAACSSDDDASSESSSAASELANTTAPETVPVPSPSEPPASSTTTTVVVAVSTTMPPEPADEIGFDEAAQIVDEIASTFALAEFSPVEELLGDDGVWIAISGEEYDRSTIGPFLESSTDQSGIAAYIVDVVRADETVEGLGGHGFEMTETLSNGTEVTFWIFVARGEDGALIVTERFRPPRS